MLGFVSLNPTYGAISYKMINLQKFVK